MLWKRGNVYWYRFKFGGRMFEETTKTPNRRLAERIMTKRRRDLEEGLHGLKKRVTPVLFRVAATKWLEAKKPQLAPRTVEMHEGNLVHINKTFGAQLIIDITAGDIAEYQRLRLRTAGEKKGASPKTVNLEIGTIRSVLRHFKVWAGIADDVRMLPVRNDVGRALTPEEEATILVECARSRSRVLYPFVVLAFNTGMRYTELRLLQWRQIDLVGRTLTVGASKTDAGTGRRVPLNDRAFNALVAWAQTFPDREPDHYVFPSEQYRLAGNDREKNIHDTDVTTATNSLQSAWKQAKKRSKVNCRLHDLRHTACTRLLEAGIPLTVVGASRVGWQHDGLDGETVRTHRPAGQAGCLAVLDKIGVKEKKKNPRPKRRPTPLAPSKPTPLPRQ